MTGISVPRVAADGSDLTSARQISTTVFDGYSVPKPNYTLAVMQFGQFINHDMEMTNQVSFGI
jgi:peroxidase